MRSNDEYMKKCAEAFIPKAPESYSRMIETETAKLRAKAPSGNNTKHSVWKPIAAAAAVFAAVVIASAALFGAKPAIAARIPVINSIVYNASPKRTATTEDRFRIEELIKEAFGAFAVCDYEAAARCFREGAMNTRGTYLSASYLNRLLTKGETRPEKVTAARIEINDMNAEQKAFRFTARAVIRFASKNGEGMGEEECFVLVWEDTDGMHIESMEMLSEGYKAYAEKYETVFGIVPSSGESFEIISITNGMLACLQNRAAEGRPEAKIAYMQELLSELDHVSADAEEKDARAELINNEIEKAKALIEPAETAAAETAAELMYRYWLGGMTGSVCDFSDMIEHNAETDLFLWDARLEADRIALGLIKPLVSVKKHSAEIIDVIWEDGVNMKARFYVQTSITDGVSQGVGEEIVLTLKKNGEGFTVIGFDRETGDGIYVYDLKPLAAKHIAEGMPWQEAGKLAYDTLHDRIAAEAEDYPVH